MSERLAAGKDILQIVDDLMNIPDSFFKATTGREMLNSVKDQFNIKDLAETQKKDFLQQGIGYDQAVMLCADMVKEVQVIIDGFEEKDIISEKKVFLKDLFRIFQDLPEYILQDYPRYDAPIPVELCHPKAKLPTYAHDGDAGADVYAIEDVSIPARETMLLPTGLKMAIPKGWMVSVRPRSGLSLKTGLRIGNAPGTIDANYLAEVGIIAHNTSFAPIEIKAGDRIAQFILERAYKAEYTVVNDITNHATENRANEKGEQGFGSTDGN